MKTEHAVRWKAASWDILGQRSCCQTETHQRKLARRTCSTINRFVMEDNTNAVLCDLGICFKVREPMVNGPCERGQSILWTLAPPSSMGDNMKRGFGHWKWRVVATCLCDCGDTSVKAGMRETVRHFCDHRAQPKPRATQGFP